MVEQGAFRRTGYRLLGPRFDYLLHLRPIEWPIMAAHTALGAALAAGPGGVSLRKVAAAVGAGLVLWVVALNGGTLAINSAFDRDEGDVAYLRRPPPPPRRLFAFGMGLILLGFVAAFALPPLYVAAYAVCGVMSVLYSVPPFRLKAVAGADWLINMIGFGTLTPLAGWASTGRHLDSAHAILLAAFCPLFAALYPLTQLYQLDEDTRRGDRTLAVRLGVARSLDVAIVSAAVAFVMFAVAGVRTGWSGSAGVLRWAALTVAAVAWAVVLIPWRLRAGTLSDASHQRRMYVALAAWALTDLAVLAAWNG